MLTSIWQPVLLIHPLVYCFILMFWPFIPVRSATSRCIVVRMFVPPARHYHIVWRWCKWTTDNISITRQHLSWAVGSTRQHPAHSSRSASPAGSHFSSAGSLDILQCKQSMDHWQWSNKNEINDIPAQVVFDILDDFARLTDRQARTIFDINCTKPYRFQYQYHINCIKP